MKELDADVLVVGGGPVGLCAAIELSRHGISALLVERHSGTSVFPKARLITTRTMELFRAWGVQDEVESAGMPREGYLAVGVGSSLTAGDFVRASAELDRDAPQSPTYTHLCAQDVLEVILRRLAGSLADVRFGAAMTRMAVTGSGVEALVEGVEPVLVRCRYLVAADGSRSGIRRSLGIATEGPPPLGHMISIMFEADLGFLPADRRAALSFLTDPPCAVEAVDHRLRWMVQTGYDPAEGGSPEDFTEEVCLRAVRAAVGVPDLPVTLLGVMPWLQQANVATAFRAGPVFLAGDAAHVATPQGGFGMNCGIQDAHNLAWKLAAVLRGEAGEGLLDTYEAERRPIAARTVDESLTNAWITWQMMEGRLSMAEAIRRQADRRSSEGLVLGHHYDSDAVVPDGTPPPAAEDPYRDYVPTARPGHRAPHVWLAGGNGRISTLDLLGPHFTLLTPAGSGWLRASAGLPVRAVEIAEADGAAALTSPTWAKEYGLGPRGAVLIRPDGHTAWRVREDAPSPGTLEAVLATVLAKPR
ncbi:FAD-dependent monooxygenase [Planomonospora venezuelensis]|uniref:Putative polyketide hydroxylase/tetracenomycin A2 monooxygenase-dioxygenase n=1 Tax=Planomonospora venezuelensis TaxID=1999 RepID=A0A841D148_PLAVE|nr:FAD-dependent monooxygenase [Planomonospora venezuelensis]MBB5961925.1 putative polyketide hydroxylase/tetracenomycin A2 monooxygenase-dioxygenase [Planomonospora venezuelensis]GIM98949.1 FAD-dependent oxidoreductase [Planomonospora venezuelensis]